MITALHQLQRNMHCGVINRKWFSILIYILIWPWEILNVIAVIYIMADGYLAHFAGGECRSLTVLV